MKSKLLKNSIKEIKGTFKRFVSIFLMAFLGVGFFSGLVASGPDMIETLDRYYDEKNVYDISAVSTMGLTEEDLLEIKKIENVKDVYGINSKDEEISILDENYIAKFIELNENINKINLLEGRKIENSNECLIDSIFASQNNINIDDIVKTNEKEYKIVGLTQSPLYITFSKGTTNIGQGSLDCFIYIDKIEQDYFTNIYLTVDGADKVVTNSNKYNEIVEKVKEKLEEIKPTREKARYDEIRKEAEDEINNAKAELEEKRQEANEEFSKAERQIKNGENSISSAKRQLENSKNELKANKEKAEKSFESAENEIKENEEKINEAKEGKVLVEQALSEIEKNLNEVEENLNKANETKTVLENLGQDTSKIEGTIDNLKLVKNSLNTEKETLEKQLAELEKTVSIGEIQINQAKDTLNKSKEDTYKELSSAESKITNAEKEISSNERTLSINKQELENKKAEANKEFEEAESKIQDAEKELEKIEMPKWYINTRKDNSGYSTFIDSVQSMINIAKLFPLVFYIIAILTSLTSMTRMVDEERLEIGTLKALGYTSTKILGKYILYSLSATVLGGIIGMTIGFNFLPNTIWTIYKIMFDMGSLTAPFRLDIGFIGLGIAILCICGATVASCVKVLKNMPANLMRPKAPKSGKRILLEKIKFIWKHLNFSQKITTRNIFRYKKRAIMTIVGITGCTALILAGFGLKDSITGIVSYQYGEICKYQELINVKSVDSLDLGDLRCVEANMKTVDVLGKDANLIVSGSDIKDVINFYSKKTNEIVELKDEGILITDKLADMLKVKEGDSITLKIDEKEYSFKVEHILKNYIYNYVYMSKALYEEKIAEYETNTIIVEDKLSDEKKAEILNNENVFALMDVEETMKTVDDMLGSLNYVVIILIVSAALLAFVVLYNLANINIGERIREIATLKVLGFYNKEVDNYISKETRIFTAIGIIFGMFAGYILCNFLISTCEVEICRFVKEIKPLSYLYSILITIFFTFIVNIVVHKALKKVDMIESLKSVE